jgi:hypothetical protein
MDTDRIKRGVRATLNDLETKEIIRKRLDPIAVSTSGSWTTITCVPVS